jgi:hypothetical protein
MSNFKRPELFKFGPQYVEAMEVLIIRYKEALKLGISKNKYEDVRNLSCTLCACVSYNGFPICEGAGRPWYVIKGYSCIQKMLTDTDLPFTSSNPTIIKQRIKELKQWIKMYKQHMNKEETDNV